MMSHAVRRFWFFAATHVEERFGRFCTRIMYVVPHDDLQESIQNNAILVTGHPECIFVCTSHIKQCHSCIATSFGQDILHECHQCLQQEFRCHFWNMLLITVGKIHECESTTLACHIRPFVLDNASNVVDEPWCGQHRDSIFLRSCQVGQSGDGVESCCFRHDETRPSGTGLDAVVSTRRSMGPDTVQVACVDDSHQDRQQTRTMDNRIFGFWY
mmetsp:Transcript_14485/g.33455  ORF Transcript_14485/g.33455 Transcript_14485/m.33455 type:complete len:214 (-) Transcript_14485:174-815(-)